MESAIEVDRKKVRRLKENNRKFLSPKKSWVKKDSIPLGKLLVLKEAM